jgi:hypothetical protein
MVRAGLVLNDESSDAVRETLNRYIITRAKRVIGEK